MWGRAGRGGASGGRALGRAWPPEGGLVEGSQEGGPEGRTHRATLKTVPGRRPPAERRRRRASGTQPGAAVRLPEQAGAGGRAGERG